jgi:hypothetical protein
MSSDLSAALDNLAHSSRRLNSLTDQATSTVHKVEELLARLSIGIKVSIPFGAMREKRVRQVSEGNTQLSNAALRLSDQVSDVLFNDQCSLEYRKSGKDKRFRIVVKDFNNDIISWDELPRDLKIQAVTVLPMLIRELAFNVQSRIEQAESALGEVNQILHGQKE